MTRSLTTVHPTKHTNTMSTNTIQARLDELALLILATSSTEPSYLELCCEHDALTDMLDEGFCDD